MPSVHPALWSLIDVPASWLQPPFPLKVFSYLGSLLGWIPGRSRPPVADNVAHYLLIPQVLLCPTSTRHDAAAGPMHAGIVPQLTLSCHHTAAGLVFSFTS